MRAAIADMVPATKSGSGYGIFNAAYGLCWFAGSAVMGVSYSAGIRHIVEFAIAFEVVSVPLLLIVWREATARGHSR
jgi:hypothetical protein